MVFLIILEEIADIVQNTQKEHKSKHTNIHTNKKTLKAFVIVV